MGGIYGSSLHGRGHPSPYHERRNAGKPEEVCGATEYYEHVWSQKEYGASSETQCCSQVLILGLVKMYVRGLFDQSVNLWTLNQWMNLPQSSHLVAKNFSLWAGWLAWLQEKDLLANVKGLAISSLADTWDRTTPGTGQHPDHKGKHCWRGY